MKLLFGRQIGSERIGVLDRVGEGGRNLSFELEVLRIGRVVDSLGLSPRTAVREREDPRNNTCTGSHRVLGRVPVEVRVYDGYLRESSR